jgi:hypothetical protein
MSKEENVACHANNLHVPLDDGMPLAHIALTPGKMSCEAAHGAQLHERGME